MHRTSIVALLLFIVAGCKMDIASEVYTSDIRAIAQLDDSDIEAPTTIAIGIPSTKKCAEYTNRIAKIMVGILDEYKATGCTDVKMDSYLNLATKIPIRHESSNPQKSLLSVMVLLGTGRLEGKLIIRLVLNRSQFQLLNSRMQDEFNDTIDLAKSKIELKLNNDERKTARLWVQSVFVDSEPIYRKEIALDRRDSVSIMLSNVGTALLAAAGSYNTLLLQLGGKEL